jgi:hypothetical protein
VNCFYYISNNCKSRAEQSVVNAHDRTDWANLFQHHSHGFGPSSDPLCNLLSNSAYMAVARVGRPNLRSQTPPNIEANGNDPAA